MDEWKTICMMNKINYFCSPIYKIEKQEWLKKLNNLSEKHIKEAKLRDEKNILKERKEKYGNKVKDFGHSYHSLNLSLDKEFSFFNQFVGEKSFEILIEQGYSLKEHVLIINECWVQEFTRGGHHIPHIHSNNHISGFYFLKCSEKSSFPIFHDPRPSKVITNLPEQDEKKITDASVKFFNIPKPGDLFLFNSYLTHEYSFNYSEEPFRFIHFNIQAIPRINV
jgi:uncharacterized protein (TIGR02466 family)